MVKIQVDSSQSVVCCKNMTCRQWTIAFCVITVLITIGISSLAGWIIMSSENEGKEKNPESKNIGLLIK